MPNRTQLKTHAFLFTAENQEAEEEIPKMNVPSAAVACVQFTNGELFN
jgi:hypothetical protein